MTPFDMISTARLSGQCMLLDGRNAATFVDGAYAYGCFLDQELTGTGPEALECLCGHIGVIIDTFGHENMGYHLLHIEGKRFRFGAFSDDRDSMIQLARILGAPIIWDLERGVSYSLRT